MKRQIFWQAEMGERGDRVGRKSGLELEAGTVVDDAAHHLADVVGEAQIRRHQIEQLVAAPVGAVPSGPPRRRLAAVVRDVGQKLLDPRDAVAVVLHQQIGHAGALDVLLGAAQLLQGGVDAHLGTQQLGPGDHHAGIAGHGHEVADRAQVGVAADAQPHHRDHDGHLAAQRHQIGELGIVVGALGADLLLEPGAGALGEDHQGEALLLHQSLEAGEFPLADLAHGAAAEGHVVGRHRHPTAVHLAVTHHDAVARGLAGLGVPGQLTLPRQRRQFQKAAGIEQQIDPLPRRQQALGVTARIVDPLQRPLARGEGFQGLRQGLAIAHASISPGTATGMERCTGAGL